MSVRRGRPLKPEEVSRPAPEPLPRVASCARGVVRLPPVLLGAPSGDDLGFRPLISPADLPLGDDIVGATRELPVADRGVQGWAPVALRERPLRGSERRDDLVAAAAGAQVTGDGEFLRDVQSSRSEL